MEAATRVREAVDRRDAVDTRMTNDDGSSSSSDAGRPPPPPEGEEPPACMTSRECQTWCLNAPRDFPIPMEQCNTADLFVCKLDRGETTGRCDLGSRGVTMVMKAMNEASAEIQEKINIKIANSDDGISKNKQFIREDTREIMMCK